MFPDIDWAFGLADRFPQLWLDLTNVPGSLVAMKDREEKNDIKSKIATKVPIMCGSNVTFRI